MGWPSRRSRFKTTEQNATAISHGQFKPLIFSGVLSPVPGDGIGGFRSTRVSRSHSRKPVGKIRARSWNLIQKSRDVLKRTDDLSHSFLCKNLEQGRIYTVTYKKGWKLTGSDQARLKAIM